MSFRLRALALVMLLVIAATAATAWLTLRQATREANETAAADRADINRVTGELRQYGLRHGTWDGVGPTVRELSADTGQRIRVTTATGSGAPLADSDVLMGRKPRRTGTGAPLLVDPRPELRLPDGLVPVTAFKRTITEIAKYRSGTAYAACLTRSGFEVTVGRDDHGVPTYSAGRKTGSGGTSASRGSCQRPKPTTARFARYDKAGRPCVSATDEGITPCLQRVFAEQISDVAPPPLQVRLGALDEPPSALAAAPAVTVAVAVAVAAILGALLLSRTVLRPVSALTAASHGLGEGDLARRVPVTGRDEIAELGRSFNRMAESLQASEERQRRLVGDVAHELRTPLANLRGYLEALRDGVVDPEPELLASLHEEVLLQQRIVDDLQDLALAEAGALTYHREDIDLGELLETCRTVHRAQAERAGVALTVETPGGEPLYAHADADRLRQAVGNLVSNAVRATGPGGTVRLSLARRGAGAVVQVGDTGHGIPAEHLPHVFDRFWRADAARGRATGGSGLGLSIARQIVTDHQGTIGVESAVGAGTTFTIELPTTAADATP
ncbi:Histidine kinase [Streptomyces bingchenggensis BCW-1]|uniref:histidine kinase n=1 Tax=Streptomyces bingchenggensis (strain BCW-1) TaxID=749414 RepID=D7BVW4_STRBB|nr:MULTISPECIES: ATP-binding protein [Streptomyces]ADI09693.1 Histidine kinase [Streptomyces bingchenggensis BCW-1]